MSPELKTSPAAEPLSGGRPMTSRFSLRRTGALVLAGALLFILSGDRVMTAPPLGIDPLEVLNLQVKPNVVVALDTSGSMEDTPYVASSYGGDYTRSKMWQAKQVLKAVFQDNQDKASFLFGVYRYSTAANPVKNMTLRVNGTPNRFVYSTQSWAAGTFPNPACTLDPTSCPSPNPANVTLPIEGAAPSMASTNLRLNSLYAFQWIQSSGGIFNNTLVFNETAGPTCTVNVTPDFYTSGAALATAIQTAMNGCGGRANTYTVVYGAGSRVVSVTSITRAGTTATVTTATPHGFANGNSVTMAGAAPAGYNGAKTIGGVTANTFTYTVANTLTTPATGAITASVPLGAANTFTFQGSGTRAFTLQFAAAATTIEGVLAAGTTNRNVAANASWATGDARINLLARTTGNILTETYDPDGPSTTLVPALDRPSPIRVVTTYNLDAQKYWNGETVYVDASGNACDIAPTPVGGTTNPPTVTLQLTSNCANGAGSADPANRATFTWGGGLVGTAAGTCQGFDAKVPLIPCNQTTPLQYDGIAPFLENQLPLDDGSTVPADAGKIKGYAETSDGTGTVTSNPGAGGVIASSNTPLAQTANDVRTLFAGLWNTGQVAPKPALDPIKNHLSPKEKTIFILVTDGDQNCTPFTLGMTTGTPYVGVTNGDDSAALGAAAATQKLYDPAVNGTGAGTVNADGTITGDPAASVTTYVVAFGADLSKARADWIAWGGSGMRSAFGQVTGQDTWKSIPTQAMRDACKTCVDSFLAPDPDTLKDVLDKVINQGATSGEFTAQQSLTDSIFELSGDVPQGTAPRAWSPMNPGNRYDPLIPHRFASTFTLPLFTGQIKAFTNDGPDSLTSSGATCTRGNACMRWSANDTARQPDLERHEHGLPGRGHQRERPRPVQLRQARGDGHRLQPRQRRHQETDLHHFPERRLRAHRGPAPRRPEPLPRRDVAAAERRDPETGRSDERHGRGPLRRGAGPSAQQRHQSVERVRRPPEQVQGVRRHQPPGHLPSHHPDDWLHARPHAACAARGPGDDPGLPGRGPDRAGRERQTDARDHGVERVRGGRRALRPPDRHHGRVHPGDARRREPAPG